MTSEEDVTALETAALLRAFVASLQEEDASLHVGHRNRMIKYRFRLAEELRRRNDESRQALLRLLDHPDPDVQLSAAIHCRSLDRAAFLSKLRALGELNDAVGARARDALRTDLPYRGSDTAETQEPSLPAAAPHTLIQHWQARNPPPPAMPEGEIKRLLQEGFPGLAADRLFALARPAIGLWPQAPQPDLVPTASRWGGMPLAPPTWSWPCFETEPMFFLGQINCAELHGLPAAEQLPDAGLLAFFADHDAVTGCDDFGESRVFHWPELNGLRPAEPPVEVQTVFPRAALAFRPLLDLSHPHSRAVSMILSDPEDIRRYYDLYELVAGHGIPEEVRNNFYCSRSKLFGWPRPVQNDLAAIGLPADKTAPRLLLQIDPYGNGSETEGWGAGGALYFLIRDADLRRRRFDRVEFEMQSS